jgi:hypothetical protein
MIAYLLPVMATILYHIASLKILEATSSPCGISPCNIKQYSRLSVYFLVGIGIRCLVELPFAFIKQHMKFRETRYLGIQKNQQHFFMLAACYNLRQTPALIRAKN